MRGAAFLLWAGLASGYDPAEEARRLQTDPKPEPVASRTVRVALAEGQSLDIRLRGTRTGAGRAWPAGPIRAERVGAQVQISAAGMVERAESVDLSGADLFCLGAKCYRGTLRLSVYAGGLVALDVVGLEDYLRGVVPGEIGRKLDPSFYEAARAQAVVARTYTVRSLGQYAGKPWDLRDDVRDQVYDGALGEDSMCSRAVRSTVGQILVDSQGRPVDAYYHATSGGHTADIADVWPQKPVQPYLRGVWDTAPDGRAWGGAVPSAAWTETWTAAELHDAVRRDLSEALGRKVDVGPVRSLRLEGRDSSGRARRLVVEGETGAVEVVGDRIRWALRRKAKGNPILRGIRFELRAKDGLYVAEGTGNGHGVGLSQNGAMGRAHAGQTCNQILSAYYPGTVLRNIQP